MHKFLGLIFLLISQNLFAWGVTGHRVVGEVAQKHLTSDAQKKVSEILNGASLAIASTWSDEIKSEPKNYKHTFSWHYTDWPNDEAKYNYKENSGSLLQAIDDQIKILKSKKSMKEKKAFALKFLTHLIGDLHQPLHVGNGKDRGGNDCSVTFHDQRTNLHRLWDEDLINFTKLSFTEMSDFVIRKHNSEKLDKSVQLENWAQESKEIRLTIYPEETIKSFKTTKDLYYSYCRRKFDHKDEELPKLSWQYSYQNMPIIEKRLYFGGMRLALILNTIL